MTFIAEVFSEADGKPSWSRMAATLVVLAVISWITFLVIKDMKLPDLSGATLFLGSGVGATYGSNKIASAISGDKAS